MFVVKAGKKREENIGRMGEVLHVFFEDDEAVPRMSDEVVHDAGFTRATGGCEENVAGADVFPEIVEEFVSIAEIG